MPQYDTENMITNTLINTKTFSGTEVWIIISVLVSVIVSIVIFNTYFSKDKENKYSGIKKIIYDFIHFKITIVEPTFKVFYLISALVLTLSSLTLITVNFYKFISTIVFGNIILRIIFELLLLTLKLFKDVSEINKKKK